MGELGDQFDRLRAEVKQKQERAGDLAAAHDAQKREALDAMRAFEEAQKRLQAFLDNHARFSIYAPDLTRP